MDEARRSVDGIERKGSELSRLRETNAALVEALEALHNSCMAEDYGRGSQWIAPTIEAVDQARAAISLARGEK